ncbi:Type I restriction-modification system, specificity subunit S [Lunatimonas lonarensis]|uniref:Type I restriction-modification system, specificity subunit S n=1 Tax=Lunatimonas lonarensis TaxID=1232681 RepID=R7ZMU5_9BACT|nr:restriction endonuclease subunit S [Lunatimonas lonarensis]EON75339.1 Type I restriction-modification system, specificity subunit S [Lunatimonas lonarensis]
METKNIQGYKQTEVGLIPEEWEVLSIDKIFDFYSTSNYSKAEMTLEGEIGCIHYGLIHAITKTSYNLQKGIKFFIKPEQAKYAEIKDGDVVMVDASEDMEGVNKSIEVFGVNDKRFIAGLHTYLLRDTNLRLANNFRGAILNSSLIKNQFNRLAVGMKVFGVSKPQLKTVLIPVPPFPEQTAIASALSDMDALIAQTEKLIEKKKAIKQGVMQELLKPKEGWVTRKLGEVLKISTTLRS